MNTSAVTGFQLFWVRVLYLSSRINHRPTQKDAFCFILAHHAIISFRSRAHRSGLVYLFISVYFYFFPLLLNRRLHTAGKQNMRNG